MIGRCWFERVEYSAGVQTVTETIRPWEDYGLYLVNYDAPPPAVRTYRANIEGLDGTLDLTEWEGPGIVRYNDRTVAIRFRDMNGRGREMTSAMLGKRFNIHFDDDPEHYYYGRCDQINEEIRQHINNIDMTFTCAPFRKSAMPTVRTIAVAASGSTSETTYKTERINIASGIVYPTFSASGVEDIERPSGETVTNTRTGHYAASLYTLWTTTAGGRSNKVAMYGKSEYSYDNNTGVIRFDGLDLTGATVKSISLTISAAEAGYGTWYTKTIKLHKPASGVAFDPTMKGEDYAGDTLGVITGQFRGNTQTIEITGTTFDAIAAWFAEGGDTILLYDPTETAARDPHSTNYCKFTDVQIDVVYEESEPSPETDKSTIEIVANGMRQEYKIEADGVIHTDGVIFRAGENLVTVNNHNVNTTLTVTVAWNAEVI